MSPADIQTDSRPHAGVAGVSPSPAGAGMRRHDYAFAALVALVAAAVYLLTVQPTLSFWDCGEFIACSAILGVPHPPGTPLYILLGRLFAMLPAPADVGLRVNLLSVCSSMLATGLAYLIVVRIARRFFFGPASFWGREWILFVAGLCGAVLSGFGRTVWNNAIEAEVYGVTLLLFFVLIYVALVWLDARTDSDGARLLVLATFCATLGLGVHMMVFLAMPGLWLLVFLMRPTWRRHWALWTAVVATLAIMATGVSAYLWNLTMVLGVGLFWSVASDRRRRRLGPWIVPAWCVAQFLLYEAILPLRRDVAPDLLRTEGLAQWFEVFYWTPFDWGLSLGVLVVLWAGSVYLARRSTESAGGMWALPVALVAASLVGFSVHGIIPVRSRWDPAIDENNPETWQAFKGFVERKQYGSRSMVSRMFSRRGDWSHQLGRHPRMGFWSFFEKQYGLKSGPLDLQRPEEGALPPAFLLLVALGLLGVGYLGAVHWRAGLPLLLTLLLTTVGLVIYMNFADGTRFNPQVADQAYLEVRDRDYFFTTGFALFGICIGLGTAAFMRLFHEPRRAMWRPVVGAATAVFLFALPIKTIQANYWTCDRSRDFIPYDYAWNLLESCDDNGILFTNGDNDTFPLWCLQEAYGVRRDVRIINLSLANTHWYLHQLKDLKEIPFALTHDQIDLLRPSAQLGRVQSQVINIVLESNAWQVPVYFGTSSPQSVRRYRGAPLDSNLRMEGMVLRLVPERGDQLADPALVLDRYYNLYRFRGVGDTTVHKNEATSRIADNYATGLLFVADRYRRARQPDSAMLAAELAVRLRPRMEQPRVYLVQLAGEFDLRDVVDSLLAATPDGQDAIHYNFGLSAELTGSPDRALPAYRRALEVNPRYAQAFQRSAALLYERQEFDTLLQLIDAWMAANPGDTVGPQMRAEVEALLSLRRGPVPEDPS